MLSKKMTFSLMSLITILALAFVVSPAMAGTFKTDLSGDGTIHAGQDIDVTIKFDAVVSKAAVQGVRIDVTVVKDDFSSTTYQVTGDAGAKPKLATDALTDAGTEIGVLVRLCRRTLIFPRVMTNTMVKPSCLPFRLLNSRKRLLHKMRCQVPQEFMCLYLPVFRLLTLLTPIQA